MAKPKNEDTTRDDVNEGDVRATVAEAPEPRPSNPQTYDGGEPLTSDNANLEGSEVDNAAKGAPEPAATYAPAAPAMVKVEPAKHEQLKGARVRLSEVAYINDVLYNEGAILESYSGPAAPHIVEIDDKGEPVRRKK